MALGASVVIFGYQGGSGGGGGGSQSWAQVLVVGNESGGNNPIISEGDVLSFGSNTSFYGDLFVGTTSLTANRTWELPNQSGVIALVSDIPANTNIYNSNGNIPTSRVVTVDDLTGSLLFQNGSSQALFSMTFDGVFRLGLAASAFDNSTVTIGVKAETSVVNAIAIGSQATAGTPRSVVIGVQAIDGTDANGNNTIIGGFARTNNYGCTAVGYNSESNGQNATAIGLTSKANGGISTSVGTESISSGFQSSAFGYASVASGWFTFTGGASSEATTTAGIAIGWLSSSSGSQAIAIGRQSLSSGENSIAIGYRAVASQTRAFLIAGSDDGTIIVTNSTANSFGVGWNVLNPDMLFAKSATSYLNFTGSFWIGDGSAAANEGAPNNIPASISKLTVKGNIEVVGNGTGNVGVVVEADDGNRVLMQLVEVSTGVYAWNTGTIV